MSRALSGHKVKSSVELIAKAEENTKWLGRNYDRLAKKYDRRWVAVLDKQVIDSDKDLQTLVTRLKKKLSKKYPEATIDYVTKETINMVLVI